MVTEAAYFNESFMITPNIDRLGKGGLVFNKAYCQQAICGPTRNSFLSGRRPQRTKSWNFKNSFRDAGAGPKWKSFPQYFKENGYTTLGTGKTFHPNLPLNFDLPLSWTNYGKHSDGTSCAVGSRNGCQVPEPVPPSDSNRSYVFSPNGYPQCTQPEANVSTRAIDRCLPVISSSSFDRLPVVAGERLVGALPGLPRPRADRNLRRHRRHAGHP